MLLEFDQSNFCGQEEINDYWTCPYSVSALKARTLSLYCPCTFIIWGGATAATVTSSVITGVTTSS